MNWKHSRMLYLPRLVLPIGVALLFLGAIFSFFGTFSAAQASASLRFVDSASGSDTGDCMTATAPCASVTYALSQSLAGDEILVAQGTYTENLVITIPVSLVGGYEAVSWTRDIVRYKTILDGSNAQTIAGDWDGVDVKKAAVIKDGADYLMWFDGTDLFNNTETGLAASTDGITWTKYLTNPVLTGTPGAWDETGEEHGPFVLKEDGVYKMWYEGSQGGIRQMGYATSTNGIDWTKHPANPVLAAGPETYDQEVAGHGSVINDNGTYKLWYHAIGDQGPIIAYATSPDGINWTKQGPVLYPEGGGWDEYGLWGPSVLKLNGEYWMWYTAYGPAGPPAIGVVTSTNGISWTRFLSNPVLGGGPPIGDPHVITGTGVITMYLTNYDNWTIEYATSTNGVDWTIHPGYAVLSAGNPVSEWGQPVVRFEGSSTGAVLDGFTIQAGSGQFAGGVSSDGDDITIRNTIIRNNYAFGAPDSQGGSGLLAGSGGTLTIHDSQIIDNQVGEGAGGIRLHDGYLVISNTIIAGNRGDMAMHLNSGALLMHATVANNDGGVLINPDFTATLAVTNSIIYSNGWSVAVEHGGSAQIAYSDIEGGWTGTGTLDVDPGFVDQASGDYHLLATSQVKDMGTATGAPDHDFEGDPRPQEGGFDIGADEFVIAPENMLYLPVMRKD